jgi:malate dehydrogenase
MGFIAILGAGALGGAIAHALAARDRVSEVRLIDSAHSVARGKALDILQSSPIDGFRTHVSADEAIDRAVGADLVIVADASANQGEHSGEAGLALLRQLVRVGSKAPILCAGATQRELIRMAVNELHLPRTQVLGSAPLALESALRAMAGLAIDGSAVEVSLRVVGVPPRGAVVAWEEASAFGQPLSSHLPAHVIAALADRIPGLWPPGPYALAAACARVAEAIVGESRRRFSCFVALDAGPTRVGVCSMPVRVGQRGIVEVLEPALTRQERTRMENAMETADRGS